MLRWGICAVAYGAILLTAAMLPRSSVLRTGAPYCDDDMCMTVGSAGRTPARAGIDYRFAIRLFSRARHGTRSTRGASVYLIDGLNRRLRPIADPSAIPFNVDVQPGTSVNTSLTFNVPKCARALSLAASVDRRSFASLIVGNGDLLIRRRLKLLIE